MEIILDNTSEIRFDNDQVIVTQGDNTIVLTSELFLKMELKATQDAEKLINDFINLNKI